MKSKRSRQTVRVAELIAKQSTVGLNQSEQRELSALRAKSVRPVYGDYSRLNDRALISYGPRPQRVRKRMSNLLSPYQQGIGIRPMTSMAINESIKQRDSGLNGSSEGLKGLVWQNLGNTERGRDWAYQALHPCGDGKDATGLPDTVCAAVATPSYRAESAISWDTTMFKSTPPDGVTTYSVQIIIPPIPEIDYIYRLRDDAHDVWSYWRAVRLPGFNRSGTLKQSDAGVTLHTIGYSQYRIIGRGATLELNASDIANQGRVISGQIDTLDHENDMSHTPKGTIDQMTTREVWLRVPQTSGFLVANAPNVYQEEAKCGAYVVMKFKAPLKGFQFSGCNSSTIQHVASGGEKPITHAAADSNLLILATDQPTREFSDYFTVDSRLVVEGATSLNPDVYHPFVSNTDGTMTSVTFFEGLVIGQGGAATATGATIRVKSRLNLECLSFGGPGIAPFIHPGPLYDDLAITQVAKIAQMAPDAYPASFNSFGTVVSSIWSWMKRIGRPLLTGVSAAFPAAAPIAGLGLAGMEAVDNVVSGIANAVRG